MKRLALILALVLTLPGCGLLRLNGTQVSQLDDGIEQVAATNASLADVLTQSQAEALATRRRLLFAAAELAPSRAAGEHAIEQVRGAFDPVFEAFRLAEVAQTALADAIDLARAARSRGEAPDVGSLLILAGKVQTALSEALRLTTEASQGLQEVIDG